MKLIRKIISAASAVSCTAFFCSGVNFVNGENYSDQIKYGDYIYYKMVDENSDGIFDYIAISDCDEEAEEVKIPAEIDGLPVTLIDTDAFYKCRSLTMVEIPNSVITIKSAFNSCRSLTSIDIPDSVTSISGAVFYDCCSLENINVSENNQNYSSIDGVLFNKAQTVLIEYPKGKKDTEYSVPDIVTLIRDNAFSYSIYLTSVNIPNSVTSIGNYAFFNCSELKSINIPSSITEIKNSVFNNCTSLTSIEIPESVTDIGYSICYGCTKLSNINVSNENQEYSSKNGVLFNKNQTLLIKYPEGKKDAGYLIPNGVTQIRHEAFYNCGSLKSINMPDSLTSISEHAFEKCTNITSFNIPSGVTEIDNTSFYNCTKLAGINVSKSNKIYASIDGVLFNKETKELILYPMKKMNKMYYIPQNVKSIGDNAFYSCKELEKIEIPNSVTSIGDNAFEECLNLKNADLPDSVTSIGYYAFKNCISLKVVKIPDSLTSIGTNILSGCYSTAVIYCYENSAIESYARNDKLKFEVVNKVTILGDADENGEVNIRDAAFIARMLAKGAKEEIPAYADYNGDGKITIRDAAAISIILSQRKSL